MRFWMAHLLSAWFILTWCQSIFCQEPAHSNEVTHQSAQHLARQNPFVQYFEAEESVKSGDIVGISSTSGKIRQYRIGDQLIGIASDSKLHSDTSMKARSEALVGLLGQMPFNRDQVDIVINKVYTKDAKLIGNLLSNGQVFINISSNMEIEPLLKKIQILRTLLKAEQFKNEFQEKLINELQSDLKKLLK